MKASTEKNEFENEMRAIQKALEAITSVPEQQRQFVLQTVTTRLGLKAGATIPFASPDAITTITGSNLSKVSVRDFLASKKTKTAVEQVTCLAFYLTHAENKRQFKTNDLTEVNTRAAGQTFSNAAQASTDALRQNHYLASAGKGARQITPLGEAIVNALPDREALKAALAAHKTRRGKNRKKKTSN